jgi:PAS domain S-box-containing protein
MIRRCCLERWKESIASGTPFYMVFPLRRADGVFRSFLTRVMPVKNTDGKVVRWFGTNTDMNEEKEFEAKLQSTNTRLELALQVADLGEWELDLISHKGIRSLRHDQIFGYQTMLPEWTFEMAMEHVLPECRAEFERNFKDSLVTGVWDFESKIRRPDGEVRWIWARGRCVKDESGQPVRMFGVVGDITERKRIDAELRESEERYRNLFEMMDEGFCVVEVLFDERNKPVDYRFLEVNAAFEAQTGMVDAMGKLMREFAPDHEEHWFQIYGNIALTGISTHFENEAKALNRYYDVHAYRVGDPEQRRVAIIFNDISKIKRAEQEIQASRAKLESIVNSAMDVVISIDEQQRIVVFNQTAERVFQCTAAEAIGATLDRFLPQTAREEHYGYISRFVSSGVSQRSMTSPAILTGVRSNGEEFPIEATISQVQTGGETICTVILRDITERKQAQDALLRSEKLASVGRMAATIAHEINNPLDAVMNALYLAKSGADVPESTLHYIEMADGELNRIAHITRQSLGFYRESNAPTLTFVNAVMDSVVELLKSKIAAKHTVIEREWEGDVIITAVSGELRQVFSNLLANSLDAIDEGGTIKMRISAGHDFTGLQRVRVTIADNGKGIKAESKPHLFEPFFTTKGAIGTGLGLWVSKQIVDKHDGKIQVRSCVSGARRGTAFCISLPVEPESLMSGNLLNAERASRIGAN